jgi:predicted nicotinamide N-methyase
MDEELRVNCNEIKLQLMRSIDQTTKANNEIKRKIEELSENKLKENNSKIDMLIYSLEDLKFKNRLDVLL